MVSQFSKSKCCAYLFRDWNVAPWYLISQVWSKIVESRNLIPAKSNTFSVQVVTYVNMMKSWFWILRQLKQLFTFFGKKPHTSCNFCNTRQLFWYIFNKEKAGKVYRKVHCISKFICMLTTFSYQIFFEKGSITDI